MLDVNNFENRIVKFKRTSDDVETVKHAEIRQMDYDQSSDVPRSVTVRLTDPVGYVITFAYDASKKKFSGPLGNDTWESDFNIEEFMSSSKMGITDTYMKSPKRNRPKF